MICIVHMFIFRIRGYGEDEAKEAEKRIFEALKKIDRRDNEDISIYTDMSFVEIIPSVVKNRNGDKVKYIEVIEHCPPDELPEKDSVIGKMNDFLDDLII